MAKTKALTPEELRVVSTGLNMTLDMIIADMLAITDERFVPRDTVIEVVLDADFLELYGTRSAKDKAIIKKFRKLSYPEQFAFAKTVFPYKSYGL
jgi:hypothetical protein